MIFSLGFSLVSMAIQQYSNTQMKITSKPIHKHKHKSLSISLLSAKFPCSSLAILKYSKLLWEIFHLQQYDLNKSREGTFMQIEKITK